MRLQATTWQTVGPFFRIGLEHLDSADLASAGVPGARVTIEGRVLDGNGMPVPDAVIEVWQADASGRYLDEAEIVPATNAPVFTGFGRIPTDTEGWFRFTTVQPGAIRGLDGQAQAPHLAVRVMMRGLLRDLVTRMYFPTGGIGADPILQSVPEDRRGTLIAVPAPDKEATLVWNIELQGERETVFFDF